MKKSLYFYFPVLLILLVLGLNCYKFGFPFRNNSADSGAILREFPDFRNETYLIDGKEYTLKDGISEVSAAPGSASKITTRYFGNEAKGDLSGDNQDDYAFLITQETGGTGLFYYAVAAIKVDDGYKLTNAFYVGDRIAPQSTYIPINSREIQVNYATRKKDEPMTATPSYGVVLLLKVTPDFVLEGLMK